MTDRKDRESLRGSLLSWGRRQRALAAERNPLVRRAITAGITKEEIHQSTGLGRTTIDRIEKAEEASDE